MINVMQIGGFQAVVQFDPDIGMFRGMFAGLNGGADFYADSVEGLRREGEVSLKVFMDACRENGIDPAKSFSGKFQVRLPEHLHAEAAQAAAARHVSLNDLVRMALEHELA